MSQTQTKFRAAFKNIFTKKNSFIPCDKLRFQLPDGYVDKHFREKQQSLINEDQDVVFIKEVDIPDLTPVLELGRRENFCLFVPKQREMASFLINIFMDAKTLQDLLSTAVYCHDRVNIGLFLYSLSVALMNRKDTQNIIMPNIFQTLPELFIAGTIRSCAEEEAFLIDDEAERRPIFIPQNLTATDLDPEHRIAYWREDFGINFFHFFWYVLNPTEGPEEVVKKDRSGELFYFMHRQLLARYDTERLCHKLGRTKPYADWDLPLTEAYFPKLINPLSGENFPGRQAKTLMKSIDRIKKSEGLTMEIEEISRWRECFIAAIFSKTVIDYNGYPINLDDSNGIDILARIIAGMHFGEQSPNIDLYGNLHYMGLVMMAAMHDPEFKHLEDLGILADPVTASRDPAFYRWLSFVVEILQLHKDLLPPYSYDELNFPDIIISSLDVKSEGLNSNIIRTFWLRSDLKMDLNDAAGQASVRTTRLHHSPYKYILTVKNNTGTFKRGNLRIFMCPQFDEAGNEFAFKDQKNLCVMLDIFQVDLKPNINIIERSSENTPVTTSFELSQQFYNKENITSSSRCFGGWPHNLNICRGTPEGFNMILFAMLTDYETDKVDNDQTDGCGGYVYCGVQKGQYPDCKPMGYPFDRNAPEDIVSLDDFLIPNMKTKKVSVIHQNYIMLSPFSQGYTNTN